VKKLNGTHLRKIFMGGYGLLYKNKASVDALNVFPVPDGDTGINMSLTLKSVIKELDNVSSNEISAIGEAITRGALRGARGNSGVILSQILKGMMTELGVVKSPEETDTKIFARAMEAGAKMAYKAVTIPKEGTILTVVKFMAEEAKKIARHDDEYEHFFEKVILKGEEILSRTPEMLPVLKKAGVVDAGGRGLIIMFMGFLGALKGDEIEVNFEKDSVNSFADETENMSESDVFTEIEFAYCTEFLISHMHKTTTMASIDFLRDKLMKMGDSVVCVGDLDIVKVHVHTNTPGEAVNAALCLGEIINLKIDNMLEQNRELRASMNIPEKDQGLVAVAAGDGIINIFKDLGVDFVIKGGQTMNPSAEDIAEAARRVHAKAVFVFPNNKNIVLAARHAQALTDKNIVVIPTRSINEGISACIAFNPEATIDENTEQFLTAMESVKSGSVTYAVRNTKMDRFEIKQGEIIGMDEKSILAKGKFPNEVTLRLIDRMMNENIVNITLFYGAEVRERDAQILQDKLTAKYHNCEISMVNGGQPIYYYLISLE
jgi:DAK2 domain fusion protein YloV